MSYDIIIKNGMIVDGSGMARYRADVGIKSGRIATIGRISSSAKETIDAEGHIVSPGFVDGHTHMDAQVFWDPLGTCSSYHGVTSVVMGNCGFTLAPCAARDQDLVFRNFERAEDISREAMKAGIKWSWETFPDYLDVLDSLPKGINYSGYMGHSALRTYVMGERAFTEEATADEIKTMAHHVREAVRAGAMGFSTSRSKNHLTSDNKPVASRLASWGELEAMVRAMGDVGAGILETAGDQYGVDREFANQYYGALRDLSAETGRPVTFGMFSTRDAPGAWRHCFDLFDRGALQGARMFVQVHSRGHTALLSFETEMPFDQMPIWKDVRALPLEEQKAALRDPDKKRRLVEVATNTDPKDWGVDQRLTDLEWICPMYATIGPYTSVAEIARQRGVNPVELMIDLALERDLKFFFVVYLSNEDEGEALEMMKHPQAVVTFSDAGAHVSGIMDNSLQTHLLSYWVREKQAFTLEEAVRLITYNTATRWGFHDRGLLREGMAADVVIFDADKVGARMPEVVYDLPAGAQRLHQTANGVMATIVNGQVLLRNNKPTGAMPGRLLRTRIPG